MPWLGGYLIVSEADAVAPAWEFDASTGMLAIVLAKRRFDLDVRGKRAA